MCKFYFTVTFSIILDIIGVLSRVKVNAGTYEAFMNTNTRTPHIEVVIFYDPEKAGSNICHFLYLKDFSLFPNS